MYNFFFDMVEYPSLFIVPLPREVDGNPNLTLSITDSPLWWREIKLWKPFNFVLIKAVLANKG